MKQVNIDALRALAGMPDSELQQRLAAMLKQTGNESAAGKINASSIHALKERLSGMDRRQLDAILNQMQQMDSGLLQKLRNMRNR